MTTATREREDDRNLHRLAQAYLSEWRPHTGAWSINDLPPGTHDQAVSVRYAHWQPLCTALIDRGTPYVYTTPQRAFRFSVHGLVVQVIRVEVSEV